MTKQEKAGRRSNKLVSAFSASIFFHSDSTDPYLPSFFMFCLAQSKIRQMYYVYGNIKAFSVVSYTGVVDNHL